MYYGLRDVLSVKKLVTDGADVDEVPIGSVQYFIYDGDGKPYPARIINKGTNAHVLVVIVYCSETSLPVW